MLLLRHRFKSVEGKIAQTALEVGGVTVCTMRENGISVLKK